ncbi:hypothetical protein [Natrarchaeobaculum sulfurireducens]|uniref:Uncharacterized protein n=1 Tax=Natrarchaeobaculum sulfurireducens TaxID=2044521 RepID=A0A346PG51_9EURY|nr:hypothetical protein [Natrarchaeobaculum sulfurireducens]AXR78496.1 hypothetical protein AArc1_2180 [Natrarchaeobaculum sulfurireducens]
MRNSRAISFIISNLRKPTWGGLTFFLTVAGGGLSFVFTSGIGRMFSVGLGVAILSGVAVVNLYLKDITVGFVQTQPTTSAEAHYNKKYPVSDGFAEFNVFLNISSWVKDFRIEVQANGPFNVNVWEGPAPIKLDDGIIYCNDNIDEIAFTLQFAADPDDLGEGSYLVNLKNLDNHRSLYSFKLNTNPKLNTDHELDDLPSEALDELNLEPNEGTTRSAG